MGLWDAGTFVGGALGGAFGGMGAAAGALAGSEISDDLNDAENARIGGFDAKRKLLESQKPAEYKYSSALQGANGGLSDPFKAVGTGYTAAQTGGITSNVADLDRRLAGNQLNEAGLNAYRSEALRSGGTPSTWGALMQQQQALENTDQRNLAAQDSAGQQAQARSALAMKGGLSGATAERLALQGSRGLIDRQQQIANANAKSKLGISQTDEENRVKMLGQLPGMDIAAKASKQEDISAWQKMADAEQGRTTDINLSNTGATNRASEFTAGAGNAASSQNAAAALATHGAQQQAEQEAYDKRMAGWAAETLANEQAAQEDKHWWS